MGFLSGVLGAVKDDNNVKHYVKNIEPKLNDVIFKLHDSVGKGASAFGPCLVEVGRWLHYYDEHVSRRTDYIKTHLDSLENEITQNQNVFNTEKTNSLDKQYADWDRRAKLYVSKVEEAEKATKKLDPELQQMLEKPMRLIKQSIEQFKKICENRDLDILYGAAADELAKLKGSVEKHITERIKTLEQRLLKTFEKNIQGDINDIRKDLIAIDSDLGGWITVAQDIVENAILKCNKVLAMVNENHEKYKLSKSGPEILVKAKLLHDKAIDLRAAAVAARDAVKENVTNALKTVVEMNGKLMADLNDMKSHIYNAVEAYVKKTLLTDVKSKVSQILNGHQSNGIKQIIEHVKEHAAKFKNSATFGDMVQAWVCEILQENKDIVKSRLETYVTQTKLQFTNREYQNQEKDKINDKFRQEIAKVIMSHLEREVYSTGNVTFVGESTGKFAKDLQTVQATCKQFAMQLDKKVNADIYSEFFDSVTRAIEEKLTGKQHGNSDLHTAVYYILKALPKKVRDASTELNLLVRDGVKQANLGNVETSFSVAEAINTALGEAVATSTLSSNAKHPYDVDNKIHGVLNDNIGMSTKGVAVDITHKNSILQGYKGHVSQSPKSTTATSDIPEPIDGALPQAIKGVRDIGLHSLTTGGDITNILDSANHIFEQAFAEIKKQLKGLTKLVGDEGHVLESEKGIRTLLNDLKKLLGTGSYNVWDVFINSLGKLHQRMNRIIGASVAKLIGKAANFHDVTIPQQTTHTTKDVLNAVETHVTSATTSIAIIAQELYADRKRKGLDDLKLLCATEIGGIDVIIKSHFECGMKGLIRHVKYGISQFSNLPPSLSVPHLSSKIADFGDIVLIYVGQQVETSDKSATSPPTTDQPTDPAKQLTKIKDAFDELLGHLHTHENNRKYIYDHPFTVKLTTLKNATNDLSPSAFANPRHPELLDAVRAGLQGFVEEMERVYVNGYDDGNKINWDTNKLVEPKSDSENSGQNDKLTPYGEKLSKVFLSTIQVLFQDLWELYKECAENKSERIRLHNKSKDGVKLPNALGAFLAKRGYKVPTEEDKQDGELQNKDKIMTGEKIKELFEKKLKLPAIALLAIKGPSILSALYEYLKKYYEVCHLQVRPSTKYPANSYQMLQWLAGLRWNPVFLPVRKYFRELFPIPDKFKNTPREKIRTDDLNLAATSNIKAQQLASKMLPNVCLHAHSVLTAILGHGHAGGCYAVDYNTNAENLLYPSRDSDCFDLLADILERLYHQFRFLCSQCENGPESGGWADCLYGRHVAGSDWQCNEKQCPNQLCDQTVNQTRNQIHEQTGDQHPKCGVKSPLQSYLEDGLQGFLPHQFKKPGCKLDCSMTNHRGLPCKTPMGFADISVTASHTKTGADLIEVLKNFCGERSHLRSLCACIICLMQKPPQTLGDMFAFYYNYIYGWTTQDREHREGAFNKAVSAAHFENKYDELKVHNLFSPSHSAVWQGHSSGSLGSFVCTSRESVVCGPYLYPINSGIRNIYAAKYADKYLSWIVYQTETFYNLLKKLYDECNSNCGPKGSNCLTTCCVEECPRLIKPPTPKEHHSDCKSIVQCRKALPTLSKYGFVFLQQAKLNGNEGLEKKRTCQNFCAAFKDVFNKESILVELIKKIDEFIFAIRQPFIWLNVALWSLSLFYLICVMVGRLDVLHIRSHLRIPASHKITAQSLLAAAQVGRLAKISYLQP
ncbi:hypothetical protein, conserved [Babesia bigemina]|uniref:C3H1-type domain-containing protein n=1 Tax=Babesia bigemina TaxID=5866 RepID=A0A061BIT5_BABBI|nr:hypothetical protein, conserved [Babesia bigemina]CDR71394.1 hypothetical protein, conserved [Babesia bigemina]|eukprot:XP_012770344.1 hypothetical protein, conserved [Babesia bigemina]